MECLKGADLLADLSSVTDRLPSTGARIPNVQAEPLGCVWTGYAANGRSCGSHIPEDIVIAAWRRELERCGERADRLFCVAWQDGVWLAYGLNDGRVRGVHCPVHRAEREERAFVAETRVDEREDEFALYA